MAFRKTSRLVKWVRENSFGYTRLDKKDEEVFFKSKEPGEVIAHNLVEYAEHCHNDNLDSDQEKLLFAWPGHLLRYIQHLSRKGKVRFDLVNHLKGCSRELACVAKEYGRLPADLEKDIEEPEHFLIYITGLRNKGVQDRIVDMENRIFFGGKYDNKTLAPYVAKYSQHIELTPELKEILKSDNDSIMEYTQILLNKGKTVDDDLRDCLAGDDKNLLKYSMNFIRKRLPQHLEKTLTDPPTILQYATRVVRNRLPEDLENHLASDYRCAVSYAFDVIRAFACVRLPEVVHSAMVMKSFELPNDSTIKRYISECEKDTTVPGSW